MNNKNWLIGAAITALVLAIAVYAWYIRPAQTVTTQSQEQAETAAGVAEAAANARVKILESQLAEAAEQIAEMKNKPPEKIVVTVAKEIPMTAERERSAVGADFAIVTNPDRPKETVDLAKLPENAPVNLNQYNVFAYKKIIRGLTVYPDWGEVASGNFKLQEISADINKKITKDGKYLGLVINYDMKNEQAKLGLRYAF